MLATNYVVMDLEKPTGTALTWKAKARILLAAGTSPANHLDLAPMSHNTSALGQ